MIISGYQPQWETQLYLPPAGAWGILVRAFKGDETGIPDFAFRAC